MSLIIAVAVNIDPFTSRSVDTAARAFVLFLKKEKVTSGRTNGFLALSNSPIDLKLDLIVHGYQGALWPKSELY